MEWLKKMLDALKELLGIAGDVIDTVEDTLEELDEDINKF